MLCGGAQAVEMLKIERERVTYNSAVLLPMVSLLCSQWPDVWMYVVASSTGKEYRRQSVCQNL